MFAAPQSHGGLPAVVFPQTTEEPFRFVRYCQNLAVSFIQERHLVQFRRFLLMGCSRWRKAD